MDFSEQEDLDRPRFATILRNLKRENITSLASQVRYSGHPSTGIIHVPTTPGPARCELLPHIAYGSFNAVFKVQFTNGTRWVLKIPANGHTQCWDAPAAEALTSEAFTMRLIRRETSIPIPEVFAFDASLENELGCPFILMERIEGKPLHEVWWNQSISQAQREQFRIRSLHGIAEAMAQLSNLTFSQGGSLLFDTKGNVSGIGSSNVVDLEKQYANMRSKDYDNTMAFRQIGPFSEAKSHLLSLLDAREGDSEPNLVKQGACKLLRLFIEWSVMRTEAVREKPFVLAHPDLDSQNIFVDPDGTLVGIIDWDWIAAVPHCIGPHSLPKFLTHDYDPDNYDYDVEAREPKEGCFADSPAELACYRAMYAHFMESYRSEGDRIVMAKSRLHARRVLLSRKEAANMTRRSLVTTSLRVAAKTPSEMRKLIIHLFEEIEDITAARWPDMSSTAVSGEPDDREEGNNEDGETGASEVKNVDVAEEKPCVGSPASEETAVNIEQLSVDELMDAIEKLTGRLSASSSNNGIDQDSANLQDASPPENRAQEPEVGAQSLDTEDNKKVARKPRAARVCGWVQRKLQRGANCLHKKPRKDNSTASAGLTPVSTPFKAAGAFCGWSEKKLRRVAHCLHYDDDDDDKNKAIFELKLEAVRNGAIDILKGLQTKLMQLIQTLHRKENENSVVPESSEEKALQNQEVTSATKEPTRAEKRSICDKFVQMAQDKQLHLTTDQQVAMAHWVIQMLKDPDSSDMSLGTTNGDPHGKARCHEGDTYGGKGVSENDSEYEERQEHRNGNEIDGKDGHEGVEETEQQDDGEDNLESIDGARTQQPQNPMLPVESDDLPTEAAGTDPSKEESFKVREAGLGRKAGKPVEEDTGAFDLYDVCIALTKDNLDGRRMRRLREGFLGLLNQSM